ncbi:MAG TPA: hypothetical protein VKT75_11375, partial [Acidobacteriaceae bacterium]|nr:hypothetical protein [Acidobacteriaceae bacterium]
MRTRLFWCITLYWLLQPRVLAQAVTTQFPPPAAQDAGQKTSPGTAGLPNEPSLISQLPEAH